jgi:uncharacterized membrane protein YhaH (DUF805 family)
MEWYNNRFANFSGRSTRIEYGTWLLFIFLMFVVVSVFTYFIDDNLVRVLNFQILIFLLFIPIQAVTARRIRDLGFNGGFVFLNFIPYINFLLVLTLLIVKGENKKNAYGENPYAPEIVAE